VPVKLIFDNSMLRAWMSLHQTYNSVSKCEEKYFVSAGLTVQQHAILMAIKYSKTPATPSQIADWVDRHLNSITLILNRMENKGLVKRVKNPEDHRSFCLVITEKGEKSLEKGLEVGWKLIQQIMNCLSDKQVQVFVNLLEKVRIRVIEQCYEDKEINEVIVVGKPKLA
jgi:MarR family transcriptional regulator, 2-MHQ and catechol-resistance regulon repressor